MAKKKMTVLDFKKFKEEGRKFAYVTAYDYTTASIVNESDVEVILVGDSLAMIMLGYNTTVGVTLDDMIHHIRPVVKGAPDTFVVGDMPFGSYQESPEQAIHSACRILMETNCDCVKLEGGAKMAPTIRRMVEIPNVQGIKYTAPTQFEMLELREQLGPDFVIYSGSDEMAMSGLGYGADGIIGTFYNILPDLYQDLYQASLRKDMDAMLDKQKIANQVILTCLKHEMIPTVKAMMRWVGIDGGFARSPFRQYTREEELQLMEEFRPIRDLPGADKVLFLSRDWEV